ncbi:hypothetical protein HDV04_005381 [Boothiomyces sp. JEL0838]|nr:hypothetical protein HDV04_005381 [Boothiomyces sp. JEL0838]
MKITVQVGSWNVATKEPNSSQLQDISNWLERSLSPSPDIICLGFQELVHQAHLHRISTYQSFWSPTREGSMHIPALESWINRVESALLKIHGLGAKYRPLYAGKTAGIGMLVFIKEGTIINKIATGSIGTGLGGVYVNKGAVGISFECELEKYPEQSSSFCFISSHLNAHAGEANCIWRQEEADHILSCLVLKPFRSVPFVTLPQNHEVIWFLGDLNFRFKGAKDKWAHGIIGNDSTLPKRSKILELIQKNDVEELNALDELNYLRSVQQGTLAQFREPKILFTPPYKLKGVKKADVPRAYSETRMPAYCDRILYFSDGHHSVSPLHYLRVEEFDWSDHDPVVALFHLERIAEDMAKPVLGCNLALVSSQRWSRFFYINQWRIIALVVLGVALVGYHLLNKFL